jgi:hypothetical protein
MEDLGEICGAQILLQDGGLALLHHVLLFMTTLKSLVSAVIEHLFTYRLNPFALSQFS